MSALIISADDLKKTIPDYNPEKSHLVHRQSAKLADKAYEDALKASDYKQVILLSGGAASGKTEFMSEYLADKPYIILDGTLPTFEGAKIKIKAAFRHGKKVKIIGVWPADLWIAFVTFLQRERKFPDEHFYRTHSQSRKTLLELALSDLDIEIALYENDLTSNGLAFYEYVFDSKEHLIDELKDGQYTEKEIIEIVS